MFIGFNAFHTKISVLYDPSDQNDPKRGETRIRGKMYNIESVTDLSQQDSIIIPTGYHLLVAMPQVDEKTSGGLYLADETLRKETVASIVGMVVAMGPDAYKDEKRFPNGPYCEVGDWVIFRAYSGTKIKLDNGLEVRLINDESVEAVTSDPRKVARA